MHTLFFNPIPPSERLTLGGSLIGGIKETQEMLDFSSQHNITCMVSSVDVLCHVTRQGCVLLPQYHVHGE